MAYNEMYRVPDRPLEPTEKNYVPAMGYEDEKALLKAFAKDYFEDFIEYIENYDSSLFGDFADIEKWKWFRYKEENKLVC